MWVQVMEVAVIKTSHMNDGWRARREGGTGDLQFCLLDCEEVGAAMKGVRAMEAIGVGRIARSSSLIRARILLSVTRGGPSSVWGLSSMLISVLQTRIEEVQQPKSMHVAECNADCACSVMVAQQCGKATPINFV